jgi:hypothetical protein
VSFVSIGLDNEKSLFPSPTASPLPQNQTEIDAYQHDKHGRDAEEVGHLEVTLT